MTQPATYGHVAVLMGGTSSEREISLTSGRAVADALVALGHRVTTIDAGADVAARLERARPDLAFIALHGPGGEDGTIQGLLEVMGIPYTGSGVLASAACQDKAVTKKLLAESAIATPAFSRVGAPLGGRLPEQSYPVIVKPNRGGSSIGIRRVDSAADLGSAVDTALEQDGEVLIEQYIHGRELTVSVLDGTALPVVEIVAADGLFSFEAKYSKSAGTRYDVPATLSTALAQAVQRTAVQSYHALGCAGAARVDIMLDENDTPWVLEINTIPGMTPTSLLPKAAACAGMDFNTLIDRMAALALGPAKGKEARG